jgi:hypothetical protein
MPSNPVEFKSPTKGVNKNLSWSDHTPDFAVDALNVLPFDLDGRNRIIQRPGTSKLLASAIGGGFGVMLLEQTTVPLDPATIAPNTVQFTEPFTYATSSALGTVGAANWKCYTAAVFPGLNATDTPAAWLIGTTTANKANAGNADICNAVYQGLPSLGNVYTLKANVKWGAFGANGTGSQIGIGFITRVDRSNTSTVAQTIMVTMNTHHVAIYQNNSSTLGIVTTGTRNQGQTYALELRVTQVGSTLTYTVFVDGVQVLQVTGIATAAASANGVGLYTTMGTAAPPTTSKSSP